MKTTDKKFLRGKPLFNFFWGSLFTIIIVVGFIYKFSPQSPTEIDSLDGWQIYDSPFGYSIKYPPNWFAAPDPGISRGDIFYEKENFLKIRSGEVPVDRSELATYFVIVIQQFAYDNLNLDSTDSIEKVIEVIDGKDIKVYQEEFLDGKSANGQLRIIEVQGQVLVKAYFINEDKIYMIYSSLHSPQDLERLEIFKKVYSSIQFSGNVID